MRRTGGQTGGAEMTGDQTDGYQTDGDQTDGDETGGRRAGAIRATDRAKDAGSLAQFIAANRDGPGAIDRFRSALRQRPEVSAGYLGLGFAVLGGLLIVRGLASLAWSGSVGPSRWLSGLAWAVIVVAFVASVVVARRRGRILSAGFSRGITAAGLFAVIADLAAFAFDGMMTPFYPTAIIGASACLFTCLPLQPLRRSVEMTIVLAAATGATVLVGYLYDPASLSAGVTASLLGLTPVVAGASMISATDRYLARKIDQAVAESVVPMAAWGRGVSAASELRRIDSEAERLLDSVAQLPVSQPIDEATAASAGTLGDELRSALVSDHERTWLQIAVTESDHLSRTVRLDDPAAVAADLDPADRRTLLALTWLAVASAVDPALELTLASPRPDAARGPSPRVEFLLSGTHRRGIDPAIWPLVNRLGRHTIELGTDRALITVELR